MGYIFGIVGIVFFGSLICIFLYYLFNSKSNLDDVNANMKDDRRFGNYDLEDYDDDERVEVFEDIIGIADELRDMDFENTISDINKFIARRSSQNEKIVEAANNIAATAAQPVEQVSNQVQAQPVQTVQQVVTQPQVAVQPQVVVQPKVEVSEVQPVMAQPSLRPLTTDELYEEINDDFDDGIEEL